MICPTCGKAQLTERPHLHHAPTEPRTKAGKALLRQLTDSGQFLLAESAILAIEAEAAAEAVKFGVALLHDAHVEAQPQQPVLRDALDSLRRFRVAVDAAIDNIAHGRTGPAVSGLRVARLADAEANPDLYETQDAHGNRRPWDPDTQPRLASPPTSTLEAER